MIDAPSKRFEIGGHRVIVEKIRQIILWWKVCLSKLAWNVVEITHRHCVPGQPMHGHADVLQESEVELG